MSKQANFHESFSREEEISGPSNRKFGIVFATLFTLIAALRWWNGHSGWQYWLGGAVIFLFLASVIPSVLAPLNRIWLAFGLLLHKIVTPIIMAMLFFVCVAPMAIVMRAFGKVFLGLRIDRQEQSYWVRHDPPTIVPDTMKNQF